MKVERKEAGFAPIVLTIESQMELDVLAELVSLAFEVDGIPHEVKEFAYSLTGDLLDVGTSPSHKYFCDHTSRLVAK